MYFLSCETMSTDSSFLIIKVNPSPMATLWVISILHLTSTILVTHGCSEGWISFRNTCFLINRNIQLDWPEASSDCRAMNAKLAIVDDSETMRFLSTAINPSGAMPAGGTCQIEEDFWIDGTDQVIEGHWFWASSSEPLESNFWCPGNPSDSGGHEDCLELKDGHWNDDTCTKQQHFICQKDNDPPLLAVWRGMDQVKDGNGQMVIG